MIEIWKDVKGYEGIYQVSNLARVKSLSRIIENFGVHKNILTKEIILKQSLSGSINFQYYTVRLTSNSISKSYKVHRLVAINFIANPLNKPQVNHIDGNKFNNHVENLEWCTQNENMQHAYDTGLKKKMFGSKNGASKFVLNFETGIYYESIKDAARSININYTTLKSQLNNNIRTNRTNFKIV